MKINVYYIIIQSYDNECNICNQGGKLLLCDFPDCTKAYHQCCVGIIIPPSDNWICPRHYCKICYKVAQIGDV